MSLGAIARIFRWDQSEISIWNFDDKTAESKIFVPPILEPYGGLTAIMGVNLLSAKKDSTEYLVNQLKTAGPSRQNFSITGQTLQSFYQSKASEVGGLTSYQGSVYVWDMTQRKFKYFLPC